jgi:arginyl-tRNA synthetase
VAVPTPSADVLTAGLTLPEEMDLCRRMLALSDVVAQAARGLEPHRIVFFLKDTIGAFHGYLSKYKNTEKVLSDDPVKTAARLALVEVLRLALANALDLLGVGAPAEMHRAAVAVESVESAAADAG